MVLALILLSPWKVSSSQVFGLVHQVINVTVVLDDLTSNGGESLLCEASVPFIKFIEGNSEQDTVSLPLGPGRENISLQIRSNLIGIFFLKFSKDDKRVLTDHQVDVVIGRIKVEENILVNVGLSVGLGFALLIMGMDIDLQEVLQVIK